MRALTKSFGLTTGKFSLAVVPVDDRGVLGDTREAVEGFFGLGVEVEAIWGLAAQQDLLVRKLTHRRDTLEEIFLKAMGHLSHTPGESAMVDAGS